MDLHVLRGEAMRYHRSGISLAVAWFWIGSLAPTASAQITCTGTQSLTDSANGDSCSTTADGGSVTEAQAAMNSLAIASAIKTSVANSQASDFGIAQTKARGDSEAQANASDHSNAGAAARHNSSSVSTASGFSTAG